MDEYVEFTYNDHPQDLIDAFRGRYQIFANPYPCKIHLYGMDFPSSEIAYQLLKLRKTEHREELLETYPSYKDWREIKTWVNTHQEFWYYGFDRDFTMSEVLEVKFAKPVFRQRLLDTYPIPLMEGNTWYDAYWGYSWHLRYGKNALGSLLMGIRERAMRNES